MAGSDGDTAVRDTAIPRVVDEAAVAGASPLEATVQATAAVPVTAKISQKMPKTTKNKAPPFLVKTYMMVSDPLTNASVCWNSMGDGFYVSQEHVLAKTVLPRYFRHSNFSSFVRQLNIYGFHKISNKNNVHEFRHRNFRRGRVDLLVSIQRKARSNGTNDRERRNRNHGSFDSISSSPQSKRADDMASRSMVESIRVLEDRVNLISQQYSQLVETQQKMLGLIGHLLTAKGNSANTGGVMLHPMGVDSPAFANGPHSTTYCMTDGRWPNNPRCELLRIKLWRPQ